MREKGIHTSKENWVGLKKPLKLNRVYTYQELTFNTDIGNGIQYTLYNFLLFRGLMKREKDHAPVRSIAYRILLFRQQEGEKQ